MHNRLRADTSRSRRRHYWNRAYGTSRSSAEPSANLIGIELRSARGPGRTLQREERAHLQAGPGRSYMMRASSPGPQPALRGPPIQASHAPSGTTPPATASTTSCSSPSCPTSSRRRIDARTSSPTSRSVGPGRIQAERRRATTPTSSPLSSTGSVGLDRSRSEPRGHGGYTPAPAGCVHTGFPRGGVGPAAPSLH